MINLMNEYIKIVKSNMNQLMKSFIDTRYVKGLADEFIDIYTEIRYFGLIEIRKGFTVKNSVLTELRKKKDELIEENKLDYKRQKIIELTYNFFDSCIALNEKNGEELKDEIELVFKLRKELLDIEYSNDYKQELYELVRDCTNKKLELLSMVDSNKFYLKFSNYKTTNLKKVVVKYNIKFPTVFSNNAISKVFDSGVVLEDKMFVEYNMIAGQIIKDIEEGNYRKQYVVEFPESIFDKPQKLLRLLEIINHPSIQDRALLNINSNAITENRDKLYDLIRSGYKIALNLDENFEANSANIQRLSMFQYVLVDTKAKYYEELEKYRLRNLVEI